MKRSGPHEGEPLAHELMRAAIRQLKRIFQSKTVDADRQEFPQLASLLVMSSGDVWPEQPNDALCAMIRRAVMELPADNDLKYCSLSYRTIGLKLFGFADSAATKPGSGEPYDYKSRYAELKSQFAQNIGEGEPGKIIRGLYPHLVDCLNKLYETPGLKEPSTALVRESGASHESRTTHAALATSRSHPAGDATWYVSRALLEEQFKQALGLESHGVLLAGGPGFGKTAIARHFVDTLPAGTSWLWLDASSEEELAEGILDALNSYRELSISADGTARKRLLRELLQSDLAPQYVVFDDAEQSRIESIIKHPLKSSVIITSRAYFDIPNATLITIPVRGMTEHECYALLALRGVPVTIPGDGPIYSTVGPISQEKLDAVKANWAKYMNTDNLRVRSNEDFYFERSLAGNPRLIERICKYEGASDLRTLRGLELAAERDPLLLLADDPRYPGASIREVYLDAIDRVNRDPVAKLLLRLLALGCIFVGEKDALPFFIGHMTGKTDEPEALWEELTQRAIRIINLYHVLDPEGRRPIRSEFIGRVVREQTPRDEMVALAQKAVDACIAYIVRYIERNDLVTTLLWTTGADLMHSVTYIMMEWDYDFPDDPQRPLLSMTSHTGPSDIWECAIRTATCAWAQKHNISEEELKDTVADLFQNIGHPDAGTWAKWIMEAPLPAPHQASGILLSVSKSRESG